MPLKPKLVFLHALFCATQTLLGQPTITMGPNPRDTLKITFDSLYIVNEPGIYTPRMDWDPPGVGFKVNRPFAQGDSVNWTLNGDEPNLKCLNNYIGVPRFQSQSHNLLRFLPNFEKCYNLSVFSVEMKADLVDTIFEEKWTVKYFPTRYYAFEAQVQVKGEDFIILSSDSVNKSTYEIPDNALYKPFPINTVIKESEIDYGFPSPHYGSATQFSVFIYKIEYGENKYRYFFSDQKSKLVLENKPSFPLDSAIHILSLKFGKKRIGPLWFARYSYSVTAKSDSTYWYFTEWKGSGDCPAGCINNIYYHFRIKKNINDYEICSRINGSGDIYTSCGNYTTGLFKNPKIGGPRSNTGIYNINGRKGKYQSI